MREFSDERRPIFRTLATTNKALDSTSDAILIANHQGLAIYTNPAFARLFGFVVNELNVGGIPELLFDQPVFGKQVFEMVRQRGNWKGEVVLRTRERDAIPVLMSIDRIEDEYSQLIGIISVCTDIRSHKNLEMILRHQRVLAQAQLDTAKALTSTLNMDEVFARILENINQVVPNDAANIILIKEGNVQLVDRDDYAADQLKIEQLKSGTTPVEAYDDLRTILATNHPLVIPNTLRLPPEYKNMAHRTPWLNSHIGIPIQLRGEVYGFLNVDSMTPDLFTPEHAEQLALFAEQAAIAIQNAQLHERAQALAAAEEGRRLARLLHDAVSQTLFAASLIAEALPELWQRNPDEVLPRLEQLRRLNQGAYAEMRKLLLGLHPERLIEVPMDELITQLVDAVLGQTHIDIKLEVDKNINLPDVSHIALYYIIQEALHNVVKHAEASELLVRLRGNQEQFTLVIADNGRGYDLSNTTASNFGISNIRHHAQDMQANLDLTSEVGRGTRITLEWSNSGGQD